jgi:succinoglycan biosynthesis protein ExoU
VRVIALARNGGPARARNAGIAASLSPWIALLDADDVFLPGRLGRLLAMCGGGAETFDMAADDIAFVPEDAAGTLDPRLFASPDGPARLDAAGFARGNLSHGHQRGELGFLKPLMSRDFLRRHGLRYDESLRLGEDVDLYLRALLLGARFGLSRQVGYVATVRSGSLSAAHGAEDLAALEAALSRQAGRTAPGSEEETALRALCAQLRGRRDHRRFLDRKRIEGLPSAVRFAFAESGRAGLIARGILRDKLGHTPPVVPAGARFRTLFGGQDPGAVTTSSSGGSDVVSGSVSPGRSSTVIRRARGR